MESILYDVSFWVVVNFFLIATVLGLVFIRQARSKLSEKPMAVVEKEKLEEEISLFRSFVSDGLLKEAVTTVFPKVYAKIIGDAGQGSKGLTVKEFLASKRLPENLTRHLSTLYRIYEPIKFGNFEPTTDDVDVFIKTLEKLSSELSKNA